MSDLLRKMSDELAVPYDDLLYLIKSAPYRYKVYDIPKKTPGRKRTIAQPAREVKPIQRWVVENVLRLFPIHSAAVAYRAKKNIADNALPHAGHRYLCKLDFTNFFPSIKATDFEKFIKSSHLASSWTEEEIDYLAKILFWRKKRSNVPQLSIGAPSSPMLSNILLFNFDLEIAKACADLNVTYTRYADDLSFSTDEPNVLRQMEERAIDICKKYKSPRLKINESKTVHASKKGLRRVTGLVLTNEGKVSIGRDRKRTISAQFHRYLRGLLNEQEVLELAGTISFANGVEPTFLNRLAKKYGASALNHLLSTHRPII